MSGHSHLLLMGARVVTPDETIARGWLEIDDGRIVGIGAGRPPPVTESTRPSTVLDATGLTALPGFVDVHVHGSVGHEAMDADPDGLVEMARFFATRGVTAFLATTWAAPHEEIRRALEAVAEVMGHVRGGATLLGAHLEGPYLNTEKAGAQDPRHIRSADHREARDLLDTGVVRLITLAPEIERNRWLIAACAERGVTVSIGHTMATADDVATAVADGATHVTHLFNAMSPLHHREPGTVGAVLAEPGLRAELIADGVHVHPVAARAAWNAKGAGSLVLVTDALRPAGLEPGTYDVGGRRVHHREGAMWLDDGTLAGSALTLDRALRNLQRFTGAATDQLWRVASANAAAAAGVGDRKGALAIGMDADVVLVDDDLSVRATLVEGEVVHRAPDVAAPTTTPTHSASRGV